MERHECERVRECEVCGCKVRGGPLKICEHAAPSTDVEIIVGWRHGVTVFPAKHDVSTSF